ncbi:MAG: ATP-binding protein, partial [Deltaproteobacteria bacterium]|nr:ATP-binding protein [Deltaproteobacteria bacterium]
MADGKPLAARKTGQRSASAKRSTPRAKTSKRTAKTRSKASKPSTKLSAKANKRSAKPPVKASAKSAKASTKSTKASVKPSKASTKSAKARAKSAKASTKSAKARAKSAKSPRAASARSAKAANDSGRRSNASDLAKQSRDISVSEFFAKNRHLLGFDNPSKALLTTVKEGVDNSLDACEEAGILPDIQVSISQISETRFRVVIEDNGPGILRAQVPKVFGSLLYGSKFHRLRQSRGQQGIGISAAGMYGLLTTGKPIIITTRT